ncbi:MAG: AEC family transporter [Thiopseudomonas sp.]|nr:AEC family transporter [Thiopseudomonas sp.]MCK9465106.1 AEC family transporter [Thiopseudomonas sp.]
MQGVLLALWPIFALIVSGFVLQKLRVFGAEFWIGAEKLNYFFLFPALLISSLTLAPFFSSELPQMALLIVISIALAWFFLQLLRKRYSWPAARFGVLAQGALRFNTYLGLAVVAALFGKEGLALAAIILAIKVPILNLLSVWALAAGKEVRVRQLLLPILKNPLILACFVGIALNLSGVGLPLGSDRFLSMLGAASLPLGLLCVGAALQPAYLLGERHALLLNSVGKLLLLPCLVGLLAWLLQLPALAGALVVIFFALPTAPSAYILARQMGGDSQLMAGIITMQTLLAALSLPLVLMLLPG